MCFRHSSPKPLIPIPKRAGSISLTSEIRNPETETPKPEPETPKSFRRTEPFARGRKQWAQIPISKLSRNPKYLHPPPPQIQDRAIRAWKEAVNDVLETFKGATEKLRGDLQ